jgi:hypothetical protein
MDARSNPSLSAIVQQRPTDDIAKAFFPVEERGVRSLDILPDSA